MNFRELKLRIPRRLKTRLKLLVALGATTLVVGFTVSPQRVWPNLLLLSFYLLTVSLAGLVFIALQYVIGAHWAVALRRVPEAMAKLIPVGGLGFLAILIAHPSLYSWTSPLAAGAWSPTG
jgi:vacuolar-type H+-ATPase subunit I/STV1